MARIRTIKPEFPQSESMGRVSRDARLTFIQLWTLADDEGRLRGNSRMLASLLFPYDDDAKDLIDCWLFELEREDCITRYKIGGDTYVQIANWLNHQKIDKPSKSKIPEFDEEYRILAKPLEVSSEDQGSRIKDQGPKDQGEDTSSGKPDSAEARDVIDYLNQKTGSNYRHVDSNLKLVADRLKSGVTVAQCKQVIDTKSAQWGSDPSMEQYLRPSTLFRAANFEQYLGQVALRLVATGPGRQPMNKQEALEARNREVAARVAAEIAGGSR